MKGRPVGYVPLRAVTGNCEVPSMIAEYAGSLASAPRFHCRLPVCVEVIVTTTCGLVTAVLVIGLGVAVAKTVVVGTV